MSIFSLKWFKSEKKSQIEELKIEEQILKNKILEKKLEKPYKAVKLVNDLLTVVLNDGSIVSKSRATQLDFNIVRNATSENEVIAAVMDEEVLMEKRKQEEKYNRIVALNRGIKILDSIPDFEVKDNVVYLTGTDRSVPQLLVERFIVIVEKYNGNIHLLNNDDEYQGLKRFFLWCCLNPRAEVADTLYEFLENNSFRITKQGFFVALRNVVTLHGSPELVHFISNAYNKVKAVWKKSPNDYVVFLKNNNYSIVHRDDLIKTITCEDCGGSGEYWDEEYEEYVECGNCSGEGRYESYEAEEYGTLVGDLTELYLDLPNRSENRFTDAHTRTFDIRVGRPVNMPPEECNWSTADCAHAGLHFTSDHINYVGCGDVSVLILINPMKVVGIGEHKGRCYEYLPIMTVPTEESTTILHDLDFDTLELDEDYAIRELENLEIKAKEGFSVEAKKHDFNIPKIQNSVIHTIITSLEEMKDTLSKRVSSIQ